MTAYADISYKLIFWVFGVPSRKKPTVRELRSPAEYNMTGQGLVKLSELSDTNLNVFKTWSPVYQNEFHLDHGLEIDDIIDSAKQSGDEWFTDLVCPSIENLIKIELAAKLCVEYKIPANEIDPYIDTFKQTALFSTLCGQLNEQIVRPEFTDCNYAQICEKLKELKQQSFQSCGQIIDQHIEEILNKAESPIEPKMLYKDNHDIALLGGAASGKSSLLRSMDTGDNQKEDYCVICTDDYRELSFTDKYKPEFGFIITQDTAYLMKERVNHRIQAMNQQPEGRPNVILDGISVERAWLKPFFLDSNIDIRVVCLNESEEALNRAYNRMLNSDNVADKRTVLPSALLGGHKNFMANLDRTLLNPLHNAAPEGKPMRVKFHDASTKSSALIAELDISQNTYQVYDVAKFIDFNCKALINEDARNRHEIYQDKSGKGYVGQTKNYISSFFDMSQAQANSKDSISYSFATKPTQITLPIDYVALKFTDDHRPTMTVMQPDLFAQALAKDLKSTKHQGHTKHNVLHQTIIELYKRHNPELSATAYKPNQLIMKALTEGCIEFKPSIDRNKLNAIVKETTGLTVNERPSQRSGPK